MRRLSPRGPGSGAPGRPRAAPRLRRQRLWWGGALLAVLALGGLVYLGSRPPWPQAGARVQTLPIQGADHIRAGDGHPPYNSAPPTSGWHYGNRVAPWGVSAAPIPDEVQVHNLEHGGVMVQYDCPSGCPETVAQLEAIVRGYRSKVVLAPYPGIGRRIAVTAWGRLAYLDGIDEAAIRAFIDRYKNQGPEQVPD